MPFICNALHATAFPTLREKKKIQLHSSHIFIDVDCLRPSCLVSYTKVLFFVSPHVFVSLSAAKSDSTDVSQKTKQTQKEKKQKKKRRYSCRGKSSKFSHFKNLRWELWLLDSVWPQAVIRLFIFSTQISDCYGPLTWLSLRWILLRIHS